MEKETKTCPVITLFSQISKQRTLLIIYQLWKWERYFSSLKRSLVWISSRTLSSRLKELQEYDLIKREIVSEQPIRIEYTLTCKWESFKQELDRLSAWGEKWNS